MTFYYQDEMIASFFFSDLLSFVIINQMHLFSFMPACTSLKKYQKTKKLTQYYHMSSTHYQYFISKYHSYRQYIIIVTPVAETQNFMESDFHLCHSN